MKRIILVICSVVLIFIVLCACSRKTGSDIGYHKNDLTLVNETIGAYPISARVTDNCTVQFENQGEETWFFGEYYCLEILIESNWYYVPTVNDLVVHDLAHELEPGQSTSLSYSLDPYGELQPGHYRIACGDIGNKTNIYYAEFDIEDDGKFSWPE